MKTSDQIMRLLEPLRERPEHAFTQVHFRVDEEGKRITFLIEDPSPQRLLVALDYVHSLADELPAPFSMTISGTLSLVNAPTVKRRGLRRKIERVLGWLRRTDEHS